MRPQPYPDDVHSIIQIHSGGFDSTTLLYWTVKEYPNIEIRTLSIDYGQKMRKELECAQRIARLLDLEHVQIDLSALRHILGGSTLLIGNDAAPTGNQWESSMMANMVPNRNMLMLSVAAAWAFDTKADAITYGCHEENYALDSQQPFINAMQEVLLTSDWHKVKLLTPLMGMSKADQVIIGEELGIPYQHTWSCYRGNSLPCGVCGACVRRLEGFWLIGLEDPSEYADVETWKKLSQVHPDSIQTKDKCPECNGLGYNVKSLSLCGTCHETN